MKKWPIAAALVLATGCPSEPPQITATHDAAPVVHEYVPPAPVLPPGSPRWFLVVDITEDPGVMNAKLQEGWTLVNCSIGYAGTHAGTLAKERGYLTRP